MINHQTPQQERLLWEQHCCLPLTSTAEVTGLNRYSRRGGAYVSVNVGYAPHSQADSLGLLEYFRARIEADSHLALAATVSDIDAAHRAGRTVVAFDLEDSGPLEGDLDMVQRFYDLGVRSLLPTYNLRNRAGSGCLDVVDEGLTRYGRDLVARLNEVGMFVDGSHCSARTGLDLSAVSTSPMIYSHSGLRAVWDHPRNITDDQALACAQTGGVIGLAGVGIFLGPNTATLDALIAQIEHAVELVGIDHVGLGSDYCFDGDDFNDEVARNPELFPEAYTRWGPLRFIEPEGLLELEECLVARGYPDEAVTAIFGGNFRRVAETVWAASA
ncbi:dipeptidase [Jatrophihabitans sp. DSM 45814]